ncbi:hypothetical protein QBC34DRAFT_175335 [Podospora aff. communis PSN243]|uniref:glucan endo-1,3-beta-D-glucosidase n=1 Tax=Podospora aff. communis PSN243 TaxID=3040156 RepID=A0AAV9H0Y6_9PEZI|nr:hypothetical protein QBC34DRAFT_175335 [Podospora aff. communis PSN243]
MGSPDIFSDPIATDSPPASISRRQDHPQPRLGIENSTSPLQTNKFYSNFFLGSQSQPTYLIPYSVSWAKGKGSSSSWGLAVSHINASQRVFGPTVANTGAAQYYINPVGTHSLVLSATELGSSTVLNIDQLTDFSARVSLRPGAGMPPAVQFPLVQGSAFVSGIYSGAYPLIQTSVYFKTVTRSIKEPKPGITKYKFSMEDGTTWLMYAYHIKGDALDLHVVNNGLAEGKAPFYGVIQVAKDPGGGEALFDEACGVYATGVELSGSVDGTTAAYSFKFLRGGMSNGTLAMYALPHHQSSFNAATQAKVTPIELDTPTKGRAAIVFSDVWTMVEPDIPVDLGFVPWLPKVGSLSKVSDSAKAFIHNIALQELSQNMIMQSDQDSMYFSGKALAKFASIVLAASDILDDKPLAAAGLGQLKLAFSRFAKNEQKYPLLYESAWGGVVSSAAYVTGDAGADFGNSYYNDHHFHYGYFIYTAAVIGHLDPAWINVNKPFVNTLVRDISNPSTRDKVFPVWRCFDWYHGHSWAHGLFESLDGKDQESSSEDSMHAYAIKMWGTVSQDANMAARGSLMLAVQARSFRDYYLYHSSNTVQPPEFIGNKVAGILFENKIDHTTFFGGNIEYIQGIHMLPLLPHTPYIRAQDFVAEEWNAFFDKGRADDVVGGWKGILFGNLATIDPKGAYAFFSSEDFDPSWLDGGASLTWYLTYAAGKSPTTLSMTSPKC